MVNDKDVRGVLAMLPRRATYYFTKASVRRALDERELQQLAETAGLHGTCWPDVPSAFRAAMASASPKDWVFVGGSTFIVADFLDFYPPKPA